MNFKNCRKCGVLKPITDYYKHKAMFDGHINICKDCKKKYEKDNKNYLKYEKTEKGVIRVIYKTQKHHSKQRDHVLPNYSKEELKDWLYLNGFKELFDTWVDSGHQKRLKPSCDRLDDLKGYSFDNIRLVTFGENHDKQAEDILLARSTSGKCCKPVIQISKNGETIDNFISVNNAARQTKIQPSHISACCRGERKTAGGYKWSYSTQRDKNLQGDVK